GDRRFSPASIPLAEARLALHAPPAARGPAPYQASALARMRHRRLVGGGPLGATAQVHEGGEDAQAEDVEDELVVELDRAEDARLARPGRWDQAREREEAVDDERRDHDGHEHQR